MNKIQSNTWQDSAIPPSMPSEDGLKIWTNLIVFWATYPSVLRAHVSQ